MNYKISFAQMNILAQKANSKKSKISLEEMRKQVLALKDCSISKMKKKQRGLPEIKIVQQDQ